MGVLGFTTFIANDTEKYLKPVHLKNCTLIIDGNCIASHLFKWRTKRDSAFGGDYDEYYLIVQTFFKLLKKCRITPIVILDGGYEERKLPTVYSRLQQKILTLKSTLTSGFSDVKFFPLFMHRVFIDAVKNLKIQIIMCEFEADGEIAALGRRLNCPVLSLDSDFFIYDVLYIPFSSMDDEPVEEDGSLGFPCRVFDVDDFLKLFPGLTRKHLPLLAVLLGNDFNDLTIFRNFFKYLLTRDLKKKPEIETKISRLLNWLKDQSEDSAVMKIKEFLDQGDARIFENSVVASRANYSCDAKCHVEEISKGTFTIHPPIFSTTFHPYIQKMLSSSCLPPFLITLATIRVYLPTLLVENINTVSCHVTSLKLIEVIDWLLCSYTGDTSIPHIQIRKKTSIMDFHEPREFSNDKDSYNSLMKSPLEYRRNFLEDVLTFGDAEKQIILQIIPECQLFIASFLYWCMTKKLTSFHVHALLTCYIACQAKNRVGYFRVGKDSKLPPKEVSAFVAFFAPYRKTTKAADSYTTEYVHEFSRFQSILYYTSVLNTMLGDPFTACKITECFTGTVAYNLFVPEYRKQFRKSFQEFLKTVPAIKEIYTQLTELLSIYVPQLSIEKKVKRKKKNKAKVVTPQETIMKKQSCPDEDEDDADYNDLGNKFSCLLLGE